MIISVGDGGSFFRYSGNRLDEYEVAKLFGCVTHSLT